MFPGAHIEIAKGTIQQNVEYCKKEGNFAVYNPQFFPDVPPHIAGKSYPHAMAAIRETIEDMSDSLMYLLSNAADEVLDESYSNLVYLTGLSGVPEDLVLTFHDNFMNNHFE